MVTVNKSHENLTKFKGPVTAFIDLKTIAVQKGIGSSLEIYLARISKNNRDIVNAFSIQSQDS